MHPQLNDGDERRRNYGVLTARRLIAWIGAAMMLRAQIAGAAFAAVAVGVAIYSTFLLTCRVTLNSDAITRTWIWSTYTIPVRDITRLDWTSTRGQKWLVISTGRHRMSISATVVGNEALTEIEKYILAARGLDGQTRLPRYAEWVDIAAMIKQLPSHDEGSRTALPSD